MIKFSPSLLSADYARLGEEIECCLQCGADYIHIDVMDGHFVSNLNFGIPLVKSLRKSSDAFFDVHLMIEEPVKYVEQFCKAGASLVNVHLEADTAENTRKAIEIIKGCGVKTGVTIKPGTPVETLLPYIRDVDLILIMTVVPGKGGQKLMPEQVEVVRQVRKLIDELNPGCNLEVDGGINPETAKVVMEAGANVLVSGSSFFGAADRAAAARAMKGIG